MAATLLTREDLEHETRTRMLASIRMVPADSRFIVTDNYIAHSPSGINAPYDSHDLVMTRPEFGARILDPLIEAVVKWYDGDRVPLIIEERGKTHGDYYEMAGVIQRIKEQMHNGSQWDNMPHTQHEALDLIATKIGRIVTGDFNHLDHWDDIIGYATLARDRIVQPKPKKPYTPPQNGA